MKIRIELSPYMAELVQGVSNLSQVGSVTKAFSRLISILEMIAKDGDLAKLDIGREWSVMARELNARLAAESDKVAAREVAYDVDLNALETSKARSGFAGVYLANGLYRAHVPDPTQGGGARILEGRKTALEAAIDRYRWFEKHDMPYGNIGWHVNYWKELHPEWPLEQVYRGMIQVAEDTGKKPYKREHVEKLLEKHLEKTKAERDARPAPKAFCVTCGEEITDQKNMTFWGQYDWKHHSCPDPDNVS